MTLIYFATQAEYLTLNTLTHRLLCLDDGIALASLSTVRGIVDQCLSFFPALCTELEPVPKGASSEILLVVAFVALYVPF